MGVAAVHPDFRNRMGVARIIWNAAAGPWPKIRATAPNIPPDPPCQNVSNTYAIHPKSALQTSSCLPSSGKIANDRTIPSLLRS